MTGFLATLRRAQSGDAAALRALIDLVRPDVQSICRSVDLPGDDWSQSDLQQEVWLRVLSRLDRFNGSDNEAICEAMFRKWLRTTGRNVVLNIVEQRQAARRQPERKPLPIDGRSTDSPIDPEDSETPSRVAMVNEAGERIRSAIASIPCPEQRRVVELRFLEQKSLREIAAELALTYDQARQRCAAGFAVIEHSCVKSIFTK